MPTTAETHAVIEVKVPIHAWLIRRATNEPGLRDKLEREMGRQAFAVAKEVASK